MYFKIIYLFTGSAGSSLLHGLFSSCGEQGLLSSCNASPCCRAEAPRCMGFSSCGHADSVIVVPGLQSTGSAVAVNRLSCSKLLQDLPVSGI